MTNGEALVIHIDSHFRVRSQGSRWEVLQYRPAKKGPKQGKMGWYVEDTYDTLPWALRGAHRLMISAGRGDASLAQLAARIEQAEESVMNAARAALAEAGPQAADFLKKGPWR